MSLPRGIGAKMLLGLIIQLLPDSFPILIVVDDTIERRKGKKISAKGCYRDACRSTEKSGYQMLWFKMGVLDVDCAAALVKTAMGTAIYDYTSSLKKA